MAIDFFQKELTKVQDRFNQTFGESQAIKLTARFNVILSIIHLGLIAKQINKSKRKDIKQIKEFMKTKAVLNSTFDSFESEIEKQNQIQNQTKEKEKESCRQKSKQRFVRSAEA